MKRYRWIFLLALPLAACVTPAAFRDQVALTEGEKKRADDLQTQLNALQSAHDALAAQLADVQAKLKAAQDQLAILQASNKDLQQSLEAKKGELSKKVAELIKEKDDLAQKLADAEAARQSLEQAKQLEIDKLKKNYEDLTSGLKSEIAAGEIKITQLQGKLTVNMVDRILFDSGSADVKAAGKKVLDRIGKVLAGVQGKDIRIEGHTDNVPISSELRSKYASNWELSTSRATSVARYLQDHAGIDPKRLMAAGYGEYRPVASNDTPDGRALNRRIEIVLTARD